MTPTLFFPKSVTFEKKSVSFVFRWSDRCWPWPMQTCLTWRHIRDAITKHGLVLCDVFIEVWVKWRIAIYILWLFATHILRYCANLYISGESDETTACYQSVNHLLGRRWIFSRYISFHLHSFSDVTYKQCSFCVCVRRVTLHCPCVIAWKLLAQTWKSHSHVTSLQEVLVTWRKDLRFFNLSKIFLSTDGDNQVISQVTFVLPLSLKLIYTNLPNKERK